MNLNLPHAVLEVESEVEVVHQVLDLRQQDWDELCRVSRARHFLVCAELDLVATQHLHLHIEALRYQRVLIVRFVQVEVPMIEGFHLKCKQIMSSIKLKKRSIF